MWKRNPKKGDREGGGVDSNAIELANYYDVFRKKRTRRVFRRIVRKGGRFRGSFFNVLYDSFPTGTYYSSLYHKVVDLTWLQLFFIFTGLFLYIHLFFGLLYFIGGVFDITTLGYVDTDESYVVTYFYCFSFSVLVMQGNGSLGKIIPEGFYQHLIIFFESFFQYFWQPLLCAIILSKFATISVMKRRYLYSDKAVLRYNKKSKLWTIEFRVCNLRGRKSTPIGVQSKLLLLEWKTDYDYVISQVDYETSDQTHECLPLPFRIIHTINEESPFRKFMKDSIANLKKHKLEFIYFIEATDAATSNSYQMFISYTLQSDILIGYRLAKCFHFDRKVNTFICDFERFQTTRKQNLQESTSKKQ